MFYDIADLARVVAIPCIMVIILIVHHPKGVFARFRNFENKRSVFRSSWDFCQNIARISILDDDATEAIGADSADIWTDGWAILSVVRPCSALVLDYEPVSLFGRSN